VVVSLPTAVIGIKRDPFLTDAGKDAPVKLTVYPLYQFDPPTVYVINPTDADYQRAKTLHEDAMKAGQSVDLAGILNDISKLSK